MSEAYIPMEIAAAYEGIDYEAMKKRLQRNSSYKTKEEPRESGRPRTLVSVSSLSAQARKLYRAERRAQTPQGDDLVIEQLEGAQAPWYVTVDLSWYIEHYREQYDRALEMAELVETLCRYGGDDRTAYTESFALEHGLSPRTLYRMQQNYLQASAWALKYERLIGGNYDYFKALSLSRKPKESNTFPSLTPEVKALIENVWFDRKFRANRGSIEMLYSKLEEIAKRDNLDRLPSYQTVARYIRYLMDDCGGRSAAYLQERGQREWKNRMMMKGQRDIKSIPVMGIVQGDEHTFDCWVSYTHRNGRVTAIRPKLVAWIDMRSRVIMGDVMCRDGNAQILKQSFIKMIYSYGVPEYILIDNGKDYTAREMTGRARNDRGGKGELSFDSETVGFYRSIGVKDDMRSLPYEPWSKAQIERFFGTVCATFTKWIDSYTGTMTASRTENKVKKDIDGMLARGELFTMDEFYGLWEKWLNEVYHVRVHGGLKAAGEEWTKPIELFENCEERYARPAPPESYAELLMMKSHRAYVSNVGIRRWNQTYMDECLYPYIGQHVDVKYNPEDTSKLYVYTTDGRKIGEAGRQELLAVSYRNDSEQLVEHKTRQARQLRSIKENLEDWTTPYAERPEAADATPQVTGGYELTTGKKPRKVVALPVDRQYTQEMQEKQQRRSHGEAAEFYGQRGQAVLDRLKKLG